MPEANQSLQTSVQCLRGGESAFSSPGSQVSSPQVLRSECPPGLNMPHPTRPVVIGETLRFTAAVMGQRAAVKRWHTAQTAAFRKWKGLRLARLHTLILEIFAWVH